MELSDSELLGPCSANSQAIASSNKGIATSRLVARALLLVARTLLGWRPSLAGCGFITLHQDEHEIPRFEQFTQTQLSKTHDLIFSPFLEFHTLRPNTGKVMLPSPSPQTFQGQNWRNYPPSAMKRRHHYHLKDYDGKPS